MSVIINISYVVQSSNKDKMKISKLLPSIVVIPLVSLSLISCGGEKENSESVSENTVEAGSVVSKFNDLGTDLKSVLTVEQVKTLLEVKEEIKTKSLDHKSYGNVTYRWPSDRIEVIKVGGSEMKKKKNNMVRLSVPVEIKLYGMPDALSAFNHQYKEITPEEMEKARKAMAEVKARRDKEAGVTPSETEKKAANSVMSGVAGAAAKLEYEAVSGLGDSAKWEKSGRTLIILDGDKTLSISCDVSDDSDECRDAAVKLGKKIYSSL